MTANGWLQILCLLLAVFLVTKPLGGFMTRVFSRDRTWLDPVMRPVERILYKLTGVDENHAMDWKEYALALILFSGVSMILLYVLQPEPAGLCARPVFGFHPGGAGRGTGLHRSLRGFIVVPGSDSAAGGSWREGPTCRWDVCSTGRR